MEEAGGGAFLFHLSKLGDGSLAPVHLAKEGQVETQAAHRV